MNDETIWKIIETQFKDNYQSLVRHHTESYEHFFSHDIFKIFKEKNPLVIGTNYNKKIDEFMTECRMYFGGKNGDAIYFGKPCIYDDENFHYMYPNEARLRNMTYGMTVHYDVEIEFIQRLEPGHNLSQTGGNNNNTTDTTNTTHTNSSSFDKASLGGMDIEENLMQFQSGGGPQKARRKKTGPEIMLENIDLSAIRESTETNVIKKTMKLERMFLGRFPIMVQSKYCILKDLPRETRFSLGECKNDVGGYFIIDGKEKTIVCQEKFADNMLYVRKQNEDAYYAYSAEIRSISENVSKPQRTFSIGMVNATPQYKNGNIVVNIPNVRKEMPLFVVFRALGVISDKDIITHCLLDLDVNQSLIEQFHSSVCDAPSVFTQQAALRYIGSFTKYKSIEHVHELLSDYLLPHIGENNYKEKALYIGYMTHKLLRVATGREEPTDRDSYRYKRIELVGSLLYDLFREYYNIQLKNIHLEFEKRIMLNKSLYENNLIGLINQFYKPVFGERLLETGFKKAFKGNWGAYAHTKRVGVVQDLNILSHGAKMSHLRKTNLPLDASVKVVGPRVLHGSQWGYFDPIDTPDGGNIGLHKHLSITTYVTRKISREPLKEWVLRNTKIESLESTEISNLQVYSKIFLNGLWLGIVREPQEFIEKIKIHRRNGLIPIYVSVSFEIKTKTIYLFCDEGRVTRPIFYKDGDKMSFELPKANVELPKGEFSWNQLITGFNKKSIDSYDPNAYVIYNAKQLYGASDDNILKLQQFIDNKSVLDYIDSSESDNALIAMKYSDYLQSPKEYTHMEIHESCILGVMCNLIPFPENNPATRNSFSCGQSKQAASLYNTNYQMRMDKSAVVLNNGQIPLVKSRYMQHISNEENVYGENAIVAIMTYTSYNVEDAILINEGALQRGIFRTTYFTTYETKEENEMKGGEQHTKSILNIENDKTVMGLKPGYDYSQLDEFGIIREGTVINEKTVLIGSASSTSEMEHKVDGSKTTKKGQLGVVDKAYITEGEEGSRIAKVRVREVRIPNLGDKFASRAGQKGTVGLVIPEMDMPYTRSGIRPDIIVNPHALPSRMTIGQLVECITGKAACMYGGFSDCTAFINNGSKVDVFGAMLNKVGFHSSGNDILYNGMDGTQIESQIFMGPTYYMRLKHMVKDKINYRSLGPRTALTRQAVSGRANDGGLRIGEMERDGVLSHGASAFLNDSMMERGDKYKVAVCNKTGLLAIYNEDKNLFFSPMADGPIHFEGSLETDDLRINVMSRFGRDFSIIHVPYSFKLLLQELQTINVQMRLITEDNISQIENMKFSDNAFRLAKDEKVFNGLAKLQQRDGPKIKSPEDDGDITSPETSIGSDESSVYHPQTPEDWESPSPYTPDPNSPDYAPDYTPESRIPVGPQTPDYTPPQTPPTPQTPQTPSTPTFSPHTPDYSPPTDIEDGNTLFEEGMKVHFRGDFKEKRVWMVKKVGPKFITIQTEDNTGLSSESEHVKIVTPMDIYKSKDFPFNGPFAETLSPITPMKESNSQVGGGSGAGDGAAINFAPVFNMMTPGDMVGGMPSTQPLMTQPSTQLPSTQPPSSSSTRPSVKIPSSDITGGSEAMTGDLIDFNKLVIKKSE